MTVYPKFLDGFTMTFRNVISITENEQDYILTFPNNKTGNSDTCTNIIEWKGQKKAIQYLQVGGDK